MSHAIIAWNFCQPNTLSSHIMISLLAKQTNMYENIKIKVQNLYLKNKNPKINTKRKFLN